MKFDLIVIGNELLNGKIQDLNSHFLAQQLYKQNHELNQVHVIADNEKQFLSTMKTAINQSDVIITCGGLGPTKDDLTKNMLAKFFNKEVLYSEQSYKVTTDHYKRGKREYDQKNIDYHNIPENFKAINNPVGFAPGLGYIDSEEKFVFACPGVPSEFQAMLTQEILPQLNINTSKVIKHIIIKTWKVPEAKIFHELCPKLWDTLSSFGEVSSLPHFYGVDVAVKLVESTKEEIHQKEQKITALIKETKLAPYIWNIGPESLPEFIVKVATENKLTIGFSESCTGGLCASQITDISGSSSIFWGSIVSYANEVKIKSLTVSQETLKNHGAVSEQTALEMAIGAKKELGVDIAVSTTGIAGPGGGSAEKPVGTVGIGVCSEKSQTSQVYHFHGDRLTLKKRFSDRALVVLLEEILKFS
jgi:nicotinamide-nucleotide amidase